MEYVYTPVVCKDDGDTKATFSGTVTLQSLNFDQACEAQERLLMAGEDAPTSVKGIRQVRESAKIAAPYVVSVSLKRLSDGKEFKSWDDLLASQAGLLIGDIATQVIKGAPEAGNG